MNINIIVILFSLFLISKTSCGQTIKSNIALKNKIDNYLNEGVVNGFSGSLLAIEDGEIIINKGYGMANKEEEIQNSSNTIFDIGSNTKQFTGAAILKLIEQNKLNVTDSLQSFFKNLPEDKKYITIHQLLTHTGGFQESLASDFEKTSTEQFFQNVFNSELYNEPGTQFNYSNLSYSILARIIELVSHMEYEEFLKDNLFIPAGMNQTGYLRPEWIEENLAVGYNRNILNMGTTVNRYKDDGVVSWHLKGNGGINSTQADMLRWYSAIKSEKILSPSSIKKWITPYVLELKGDKYYYGYGWGLRKLINGDIMVCHNGGNGAFSHTMMWNPKEDFVLIYATNASSPNVENLAYVIEKMIFDKEYTPTQIKMNPYFFVMEFIKANSSDEVNTLKELISEDYSGAFDSSEFLNRLGYIILRSEKKLDWAIALFRINTLLFPNESNVWDSLGDGYKNANKREKAIAAYKKAYELDSSNAASANSLKELGVNVKGR